MMQFLKILFWCLLAFVAAVFTIGNWTTVPIKLWGGLIAEVNLPLLLLVTFLAGLLPTMLYYHTVRWRLRNRLATTERTVTDLRNAIAPPASPEPVPSLALGTETAIPLASTPTAVPPGVA
jgi:uncharacterized integral membrane protein